MKKGIFILLVFILILCPQAIPAQEGEFISYKVDNLEFSLSDVKLEYHPDEEYVHIEGVKIIKADMGGGRFSRPQNCESGIIIECFKQGESFLGTFEAHSSDEIPVYVSWCLILQNEERSRKEIKNFLASLDSGEDILSFSITFSEFGPEGTFIKGTFHGKLLDENGELHEIRDGKFQLIRKDMN